MTGSPQDWTQTTIGDIASVVTKGTTPTTGGRKFVDSGVNYIKAESLGSDGQVLKEKLAAIDAETHQLLARSQLQRDDVLFSIAGVIGRTGIVPDWVLPANTNQAIAIIRLPDTDAVVPRFLYYQLRSQEFLDHGLGRVVQTAQANLSLGELKRSPIAIPPPKPRSTDQVAD